MTLNIFGLVIDLIGVLLLFRFGILPDNLWQHILMDNGMKDEDEKKHKRWSKIAIICLIFGFSLQLSGSLIQIFPKLQENTQNFAEKAEIKNLPDDKNLSTDAIGKLKLKFNQGILSYQVEIKIKIEKIENLEAFTISLKDQEGFEISRIKLNINNEFSEFASNGYVKLSSKGSIKYKKGEFEQIGGWDLKAHRE